MGLDKPDIPNWDFTGLAGLPHDTAWDMWRALKIYSIPHNVFMEQPPEYWEAMFNIEAAYSAAYLSNKPPDKK